MRDFETDGLQFPFQYRGVVLDNNDPDKRGRIKVRVNGIFESAIPTTALPWAVPAYSLFSGAGIGYGHFAVPEVNSQVFVFFEGEDFNQPVYWAEAPTAQHGLPAERLTNYPNRRVMKTKAGITIYIDDTAGSARITLPSGEYIDVSSGKITLESDTDVGGDLNVEGDANVDGDVTAKGKVESKDPFTINGTPGIAGTFTDKNDKTILVQGGLIVSGL